MATGSLYQRARFMVALVLRILGRAMPERAAKAARAPNLPATETLIEALQTADLAALDACGPSLARAEDAQGNAWFFIALETGPLATVRWFLSHGADPRVTDRSGRTALEVVMQRSALADEFDDYLGDCPAILSALIAAGALPSDRNAAGQSAAELASQLGITLP
jgi:hypothetical protein